MSQHSFQERLPYNEEGKFYVDEQCLDCDLCRETAPNIFARNDEEGTSFVIKQPESKEEIALALESVECCPCEAIHSDGDQFDWSTPSNPNRPTWRTDLSEKPECKHCAKPWWKF